MREVRQCSIVYFGVPDCKTTRRSSMIEILLYLIGILSFPVLLTRVESMNAYSDVILLSAPEPPSPDQNINALYLMFYDCIRVLRT